MQLHYCFVLMSTLLKDQSVINEIWFCMYSVQIPCVSGDLGCTFPFSSSNIVIKCFYLCPAFTNFSMAFTASFSTARRAVVGTVLVLM